MACSGTASLAFFTFSISDVHVSTLAGNHVHFRLLLEPGRPQRAEENCRASQVGMPPSVKMWILVFCLVTQVVTNVSEKGMSAFFRTKFLLTIRRNIKNQIYSIYVQPHLPNCATVSFSRRTPFYCVTTGICYWDMWLGSIRWLRPAVAEFLVLVCLQ
jgi:hypothetical protein